MSQRSSIVARAERAYKAAATDAARQLIVENLASAIKSNDGALAVNHCAPAPTPALLQPRTSVQSQSAPTYTVQPGDNLSSISLRLLGNANSYGRLFAANSSQIANPSLIHPGQILVIPTT